MNPESSIDPEPFIPTWCQNHKTRTRCYNTLINGRIRVFIGWIGEDAVRIARDTSTTKSVYLTDQIDPVYMTFHPGSLKLYTVKTLSGECVSIYGIEIVSTDATHDHSSYNVWFMRSKAIPEISQVTRTFGISERFSVHVLTDYK